MSDGPTHGPRAGLGHLSDERIQEWLDGQLSQRETADVQTHLDGCARCRAEAEVWKSVMTDLSSLSALAPAEGFGGQVLAGLGQETESAPWAVRAQAWLRQRFGTVTDPASAHPDPARLQELLEGSLQGRRSTRLQRHMAACESCSREARAWSALFTGLDALTRLAPSAGFAHAVMARVRLPEPAPVRIALVRRALARVRALAGPRHRQAWAAAAGVALTPAITAGLMAYSVFSHPLVTVGNLGTFIWLEGGALAGMLGNGVITGLMENAALFRAWMALDSLTRSPATTGAGLLFFLTLTLAAVWVLYRNLFTPSAARPAHDA